MRFVLVAFILAGIVVDVFAINHFGLKPAASATLVAGSAAVISALATSISALAARDAASESRRAAERLGQIGARATEALSRSLLPNPIRALLVIQDRRLVLRHSPDLSDGEAYFLRGATVRPRGQTPKPCYRTDRPGQYELRLDFELTWANLVRELEAIDLIIEDKQSVGRWRVTYPFAVINEPYTSNAQQAASLKDHLLNDMHFDPSDATVIRLADT